LLKALLSKISLFKKTDILLLVIALCFAGKFLFVNNYKSPADDFAPIYVAARLVAEGKATSIYDHHPHLQHTVPPGEFKETAEKIGFKGFLHPYVHLPLESFLLRPLLFIPYRLVIKIVLLINILAVLFSLHLILKLIGRGYDLRWFSLAILAMCYFYPLRYGLWQGHHSPLVFLGITSVCYLARYGYLKTSGCILGGIISIKILPLFFVFYFLIKKKWALVISSLITLIAIGVCSVWLVGGESNLLFIRTLTQLIGFSLASWNNQSLDGVLLRLTSDSLYIFDWHLLELSFKMMLVKYVILSSMLVLWLIILIRPTNPNEKNRDLLDFSLTLIFTVIFVPISWSHYLLSFTFPYIVLLGTLAQSKTIRYRTLMISGVFLSYLAAALSPLYLLTSVNLPLLRKVPQSFLSSLGFLSGILLITIILSYTILISKTSRKIGHPSG